MSSRPPQPNPNFLTPQKEINSDWVRVHRNRPDSSGFSTAHSQVRVGNLKTKTATCNYPEPSSLCKVGETLTKKTLSLKN